MGWAHGVVDGREVGYSVTAVCDVPDCETVIDLGLAYRCGGARNLSDRDYGCGAYICSNHEYVGCCAICEPTIPKCPNCGELTEPAGDNARQCHDCQMLWPVTFFEEQ